MEKKYILLFHQVGRNDIAQVGGKVANLGEMTRIGIPVPKGFVVTTDACNIFFEKEKLKEQIYAFLRDTDVHNEEALIRASEHIKMTITSSQVPEEVENAIQEAYRPLSDQAHMLVAIRSSATNEDTSEMSFAGQYATLLNINGEQRIIEGIKKCWASLFEPRAIVYRKQHIMDQFSIEMAVGVQKMIEPDISGVMMSCDPVTHNEEKIVVEAIYGLGEYLVLGEITPDYYEVNKKDFFISKRNIVSQTHKLVLSTTGNGGNIDVQVGQEGSWQKLSDDLIVKLARIAKKLEDHYQRAQDTEWAVENNNLYIIQTRPITT